jgi:hypothetical protein|tara:strand:+ start:17831 stop:19558 length:1728 start_codon:yes stop_codon:yes gene_type:complete
MFYGSRTDWEDVDIIWTLEIEYLGEEYRFATITLDLEDDDGKSYPYVGGLEDVEVSQSLKQVGDISIEADSISIAITFPDRNIAQDQMNGKFIEGSKAKIGYVLVQNGQIITEYGNRPIIFQGIITTPVYGHPEQETGYVEFSIENEVFISSQGLLATVIGENMYIEDVSCSNALYVEPDFTYERGLVEVQDIHRGKAIPWVFGELHGVEHSNGLDASIPITPAYVIAFDSGAAGQPVYYLVAGHVTNASSVNLFSNTGETDSSNIFTFVNIDNRVYTYVKILNSSHIPQSVAANTDRQVWVEWDDGGAYPNPVGTGNLSGAGDICLWLLSELTDDIDYEAWNSLRPYLNQYEFAGYVNDDKITVFQWLQKNILAHLPIHVVNGPYGLKPVLDMAQSGIDLSPRLSIIEGPDFQRFGPVTTENTPEDVSNVITVRYARNGVVDDFTTFVQVSNVIPAGGTLSSTAYIAHPKSMISIQRYGKKKKVIELDYCYSNLTAQRIAQDILEREALPTRTVQYSVSIRYGYLVLGDIVEITDNDIGLNNHRCQIIQKVFSGGRWLIDMKIDENPNRYERNV